MATTTRQKRRGRWLPWIELLVAVGGGAVLTFALKKTEFGVLAWVLASMLLGDLLAVQFRHEEEREATAEQFAALEEKAADREGRIVARFAPVEKLAEIVNLTEDCAVDDLRNVIRWYERVDEQTILIQLRDQIVRTARDRLEQLATSKRSHDLPRGEYYDWLLPMIDGAQARISAVSSMMSTEWDDSASERAFVAKTLAAAERGVRIERVFVMPKDIVTEALQMAPIRAHGEGEAPENLHGWLLEREALKRQDSKLSDEVGAGFIMFDDRVALIDIDSPEGGPRGYVTLLPTDIQRVETMHRRLKVLADELPLTVASSATRR